MSSESSSTIHLPIDPRSLLWQAILGMVYGQAIGDAVGLGAEFMSAEKVATLYKTKFSEGTYSHKDRAATVHTNRWKLGAFTDDTDHLLLGLQALCTTCASRTKVGVPAITAATDIRHPNPAYQHDFLHLLYLWIESGFLAPGRVSESGVWEDQLLAKPACGIGATILSVVEEVSKTGLGMVKTTELSDPAKRVWEKSGCRGAANGALMRVGAEVLAFMLLSTEDLTLEGHIIEFCRLTHYDPRCVASCLVAGLFLSRVLAFAAGGRQASCVHVSAWLDEAVSSAEDYIRRHSGTATTADAVEEFRAAVSHKTFATIVLDQPGAIGYTYKCLAAAVTALRLFAEKAMTYKEIMCDLVACGGDADTNGAVAGKMLGVVMGARALFEDVEDVKWATELHGVDVILTPRLQALLALRKP